MGKCGQLSPFCAKNNKKTTNVEKWWFLTILSFGHFLKFFDPQLQNFKNTLLAVEISADPKILGITTLDPRESSDMRVRIFWPLFYDILNFKSIFAGNFGSFFCLWKAPLIQNRLFFSENKMCVNFPVFFFVPQKIHKIFA